MPRSGRQPCIRALRTRRRPGRYLALPHHRRPGRQAPQSTDAATPCPAAGARGSIRAMPVSSVGQQPCRHADEHRIREVLTLNPPAATEGESVPIVKRSRPGRVALPPLSVAHVAAGKQRETTTPPAGTARKLCSSRPRTHQRVVGPARPRTTSRGVASRLRRLLTGPCNDGAAACGARRIRAAGAGSPTTTR